MKISAVPVVLPEVRVIFLAFTVTGLAEVPIEPTFASKFRSLTWSIAMTEPLLLTIEPRVETNVTLFFFKALPVAVVRSALPRMVPASSILPVVAST